MELISPRSITIDELVEGRVAKMTFEPLERGYGTTLGNGLRRMLLSSLVGCAVVRVSFDGVMHEFDTLHGVREDVADIILTLRGLDIRMDGDDPQEISLDVTGPAIVTAADIQCPAGLCVLNSDLVLAHLSEDGALKFTATVEKGRGYLPVVDREVEDEEKPIGTLLLDASFSPVRRVAVRVENARVSQKTNYDKLILEVETNGAISPREAVAEAARIIQDQLTVFSDFTSAEDAGGAVAAPADLNEIFSQSIENLDVSVRSLNCLRGGEILRIGDLVRRSESEMMHMPNFGRKSLVEIKEALESMGLSLGMDVSAWDAEQEEAAGAELAEEDAG